MLGCEYALGDGFDLHHAQTLSWLIWQEPDACNYSCSSWRGYRTNEMNFRVSSWGFDESTQTRDNSNGYGVLEVIKCR